MTCQGKPGNVRGRVNSVLDGQISGGVVQALHLLESRLETSFIETVELEGVDKNAGSKRFSQDQPVSHLSPRIGEQLLGIGLTDRGQPEFELVVIDRVATYNDGSS